MGADGSPNIDAEWWTVSDVAGYLGVRPDTVSSYKTRGQMPAPDAVFGRTAVWRPHTITSWRPQPRASAAQQDADAVEGGMAANSDAEVDDSAEAQGGSDPDA